MNSVDATAATVNPQSKAVPENAVSSKQDSGQLGASSAKDFQNSVNPETTNQKSLSVQNTGSPIEHAVQTEVHHASQAMAILGVTLVVLIVFTILQRIKKANQAVPEKLKENTPKVKLGKR